MKTRICDICERTQDEVGKMVYKRDSVWYRRWTFTQRMDVCDYCFLEMTKYIKEKISK